MSDLAMAAVKSNFRAVVPRRSPRARLFFTLVSSQITGGQPPPTPVFDVSQPSPSTRLPSTAPTYHPAPQQSSKSHSGNSSHSHHPSLLSPPPLPLSVSQSPASSSSSHPGSQVRSQGLLLPHYYLNSTPIPFYSFPYVMAQESTGKSSEIFRLDTGAYGIPKRGRPSRTSTSADKALREQMNLAVQVGEDSYFVRPDSLGVADGVGGFHRKPNSNSALFSLTLMHHCALELSQLSQQSSSTSPSSSPSSSSNPPASSYPSPPPSPSHTHTHTCASPDPVSILQRAHERTLDSFSRAGLSGGASTALLATLHSSHLHIAHLGDCSIHLIRQGTLVFRSTAQQHAFNCPLQLGPLSGSTPRRDAWSGVLEVKEGDVVVMASDGMGDNLWDEDVVDEVRRFYVRWGGIGGRVAGPQRLSEALCSRAKRVSEGNLGSGGKEGEGIKGEVPFARRAKEEGVKFSGGKPDDISVVVAVISGVDQNKPNLKGLSSFASTQAQMKTS